jgi:very-short-patch-repair endonuclease
MRLVIEVDGGQNFEPAQKWYDKQRSEYLAKVGLRVLRFDDRQVFLELDAVMEEIYRAVDEHRTSNESKLKNPS